MLRKLLFLLILAGIGFGIYTGIHKIVDVVNSPKKIVTVTTGTISTGTVSIITGTSLTGFS